MSTQSYPAASHSQRTHRVQHTTTTGTQAGDDTHQQYDESASSSPSQMPPYPSATSAAASTSHFSIPVPTPAYTAAPPSSSCHSLSTSEALTLKAMTQRFYTWFKESGMLASLQTQFRAQIVQALPRRHLTGGGVGAESAASLSSATGSIDLMRLSNRGKSDISIMQKVCNTLIVEYLIEFDYAFTLSIFGPESGTRTENGTMLTREDVMRLLRLDGGEEGKEKQQPNGWIQKRVKQIVHPNEEDEQDDEDDEADKENHRTYNIRSSYDLPSGAHVLKRVTRKPRKASWTRQSMLATIFDALATHPLPVTKRDGAVQTDETNDPAISRHISIDTKLKSIDDEYLSAHLRERESLFPTLQEKMLAYEREQQKRYDYELDLEKKRWKEQELSKMKLEERARYRTEEEKLRTELRKEYDIHLNRIAKESEELSNKFHTKERVLSEELHRSRQSIQNEMSSLHQREMDLNRKREILDKTHALNEQKIRDAERILLKRTEEVESLAKDLQQRIAQETDHLKRDYGVEIKKRDDLIYTLQDTQATLERRLGMKSGELTDTQKSLNEYEVELRKAIESKKSLETLLLTTEQSLALSQARVVELETRKAALESTVYEQTARESICVVHMSELDTLRKRTLTMDEQHADAIRTMREKYQAELSQQEGLTASALQLAHAQATQLVQQWKSSYDDALHELEHRRGEEETLKQALEEKELVITEMRREMLQVRKNQNINASHPYFLASSMPPMRGLGNDTAGLMHGLSSSVGRSSAFPLSASPQPSTSVATGSTFADPSITSPSTAATLATLDAQFLTRRSELDAESANLQHELTLHSTRNTVHGNEERKNAERELATREATERVMQLSSTNRDYQHAISLPSTSDTTSSYDPHPISTAAKKQAEAELSQSRRIYLETSQLQAIAKQGDEAKAEWMRKEKEREWTVEKEVKEKKEKEEEKARAEREERRLAQIKADAEAEQQRLKDVEAQRLKDIATRQAADTASVAAAARLKQQKEDDQRREDEAREVAAKKLADNQEEIRQREAEAKASVARRAEEEAQNKIREQERARKQADEVAAAVAAARREEQLAAQIREREAAERAAAQQRAATASIAASPSPTAYDEEKYATPEIYSPAASTATNVDTTTAAAADATAGTGDEQYDPVATALFYGTHYQDPATGDWIYSDEMAATFHAQQQQDQQQYYADPNAVYDAQYDENQVYATAADPNASDNYATAAVEPTILPASSYAGYDTEPHAVAPRPVEDAYVSDTSPVVSAPPSDTELEF